MQRTEPHFSRPIMLILSITELMPSELTKALSTSLNFYLDMANKGVKAPSAKQLRMMSTLGQLFDGKEL